MFFRFVPAAKLLRASMLLLVIFFVQSCGFQLRGTPEVSQDVSPLYLQQNSAFDLARELKLLLASNKITVTNHPTKAKSQLILLAENRERRVLSVDGNGRVREYLLTYTVNFFIRFDRVDSSDTKEIPYSISTSRTLLFDPEAVLAVTNETEILYEDMRRHAAHLILLKLQARAISSTSSGDNPATDSASGTDSETPSVNTEQ